jgi:hypothetical protein
VIADAGTRFVWIYDLLPEKMVRHLDEMMERGIDTFEHTLETAAVPFRTE